MKQRKCLTHIFYLRLLGPAWAPYDGNAVEFMSVFVDSTEAFFFLIVIANMIFLLRKYVSIQLFALFLMLW